MTATIKQTHVSPRTRAVLSALRSVVALDRLEVPVLSAPTMPDDYAEVKAGLHRMAAVFIDPARAEGKRTGVDDVARELGAVFAQAARKGMPFAALPAAMLFDETLAKFRADQAQYLHASDAHAARQVEAIQVWLNDVLAVLTVRGLLGADVVQDASVAGNKTMAPPLWTW